MSKKNWKVVSFMIISFMFLQSFSIESKRETEVTKTVELEVQEVQKEVKLPKTFEMFLKDTAQRELRMSMYLKSKIYIESQNKPTARNGNQWGILQITPAMLRECNDILRRSGKSKRYTSEDRLNYNKSVEIYKIVMNKHNPKFDLLEASYIWNGGFTIKNTRGERKIRMINNYHRKIIKRMETLYYRELRNNNI